MNYKAVVIGASMGGLEALRVILSSIPNNFAAPIIIVQHISPQSDNYMIEYFNHKCSLIVKEAEEKEQICPGIVYIAPPNYHLLIEKDGTMSLTVEPRVNYSRPSIDVLFETAADAYREGLVGVILTGANSDGSNGLKKIKDRGGLAIVQDPITAVSDNMPKAAIKNTNVDFVLNLQKISCKLIEIFQE
ncbi:MAG: chemotaxis protein CheB [Clostridiaceae bacterium]|nr:chemotaxis protein CheB [Clostridiaceae bacterium]